jgi:hypothetical protein
MFLKWKIQRTGMREYQIWLIYMTLWSRTVPEWPYLFYENIVYTVMFNNSTNIKETNNHLSPKIIENIKTKHHITLEIHILTWNRLKNVAVLNRSMGSLHIDLTLLFLFLGLFFKNKNSYRFLFCKNGMRTNKSIK